MRTLLGYVNSYKEQIMGSFKNTKGGGLSFTKILSGVTGKRAASKKMKTTASEISYSVKSKYAFGAFLLAAAKEIDLKISDTTDSVIVKADVETGDEFVDAITNDKLFKFVKKTNKGKLNLGSKSRIATSVLVANISDSDAIDRRIARLKDDDNKADAKTIKSTMKQFKIDYSDYKRVDLNRIFISLAKYDNSEFLTRIEPLVVAYADGLKPIVEE